MENNYILEISDLNISYDGDKQAIENVSVSIKPNIIVSIIGPSACGKTTFLRAINRMHELYPSIRTSGKILLNGRDIMEMNVIDVRRKAGMVFHTPNVFPSMSIYDNVVAGYKLNRISLSRIKKNIIVEESLKDVGLWYEIKDDLRKKPLFLTTGQQQRLCIARTIALDPEILLMDEPTSSLDGECTDKIENLMYKLKDKHTIIFTTHNLSQSARISDYTMFLKDGRLIEYGITSNIFWKPEMNETEKYITSQI